MKQRNKRLAAFTTIEALIGLVIAVLGVALSMSAFKSIEQSSARTQDSVRIINLESNLQIAIEDIKNYVAHRQVLASISATHVPDTEILLPNAVDFNQYKGSQARLIATYQAGQNLRLYFDKDLKICANLVAPSVQCPFSTKISLLWGATPQDIRVVGEVTRHQVSANVAPMASQIESFNVPRGYIQETTLLKCPNDPKYIGIKSFDITDPTKTVCWELKNSACPSGQYPVGLELEDPLNPVSNIFVLKCTSFYTYSCPQSYAPKTFYPLNPTSDGDTQTTIAGSCVNLKKKNLSSPRVSHFVKSLNTAQNTLGKFGLRWMSGRVCPAGYEPRPKTALDPSFESALKNAISVGDALLQNNGDCSSVVKTCTQFYLDAPADTIKDEPAYACDMCPYAAFPAEGCASRNFPHPYDPASPTVSSTCTNPNIVAINTSSLVSNYDCVLMEAEFSDGF